MNRKIIMLIGILFYGSFRVMVASEAPVALFKEVESPYSNLENGKLIRQMQTVAVALTAEGKKIYDDLIVKYRNKTLTSTDNTKRNLDVLEYQRQILKKDLHYLPTSFSDEGWPFSTTETVTAMVLSYVGRIYNYLYSKRNEKIEKEIALIEDVVWAIRDTVVK